MPAASSSYLLQKKPVEFSELASKLNELEDLCSKTRHNLGNQTAKIDSTTKMDQFKARGNGTTRAGERPLFVPKEEEAKSLLKRPRSITSADRNSSYVKQQAIRERACQSRAGELASKLMRNLSPGAGKEEKHYFAKTNRINLVPQEFRPHSESQFVGDQHKKRRGGTNPTQARATLQGHLVQILGE